jgi:hypothetical protein
MKLAGVTWGAIALHFVVFVIFFMGWYLFGQQRARQKGGSLIIGAWFWVVMGGALAFLVSQLTHSDILILGLLGLPWVLLASSARKPKQQI